MTLPVDSQEVKMTVTETNKHNHARLLMAFAGGVLEVFKWRAHLLGQTIISRELKEIQRESFEDLEVYTRHSRDEFLRSINQPDLKQVLIDYAVRINGLLSFTDKTVSRRQINLSLIAKLDTLSIINNTEEYPLDVLNGKKRSTRLNRNPIVFSTIKVFAEQLAETVLVIPQVN